MFLTCQYVTTPYYLTSAFISNPILIKKIMEVQFAVQVPKTNIFKSIFRGKLGFLSNNKDFDK